MCQLWIHQLRLIKYNHKNKELKFINHKKTQRKIKSANLVNYRLIALFVCLFDFGCDCESLNAMVIQCYALFENDISFPLSLVCIYHNINNGKRFQHAVTFHYIKKKTKKNMISCYFLN